MSENIWRKDFPVLEQTIYGKPLIYLDNAATSQMPVQVSEKIVEHYRMEHANIHRGIHYLSERSTEAVENARKIIQEFLHAKESDSVIFTQGTTDSIHLVSAGIAAGNPDGKKGFVTTQMEHHSNYVPWQQICRQTGAEFFVCPAPDGELDLEALENILKNHQIRLVACAHVSNLTGTVNPLKEIVSLSHRYGAEVLVDGAQGVLHRPVDVQELDCEYYVFSGHKMLGPTGIGILYGKRECLEKLEPVRFGGGMVDIVRKEGTTWAPLPHRFEAGTPNIGGAIGLGAAVCYLKEHGAEAIRSYEDELFTYALSKIESSAGVCVLGNPKERTGVISFVADKAHPYDIASMIDKAGIAVRSGNHCAQPMLQCLNETAAVRVSPAFYNTYEEIDILCEYLTKVISMLQKWA